MKKYESKNRGIRIIELDKSYQMCTKKEMYDYLIRVAKQPKKYTLTDVLLETMSIIAYKQPITKIEVEKIRGVKSDHEVNKLVEYGLVEEVGRLDAPGRPILFGTTEEFLRRFSVPSIDDLPSLNPEQLEHLKKKQRMRQRSVWTFDFLNSTTCIGIIKLKKKNGASNTDRKSIDDRI